MDRSAYTVGWICAVKTEYVAACELLDNEYPPLPTVSPHDSNAYTLGRMGDHNVVIACLPKGRYGIASAATVAKDLLRSFESIRIGLMVGIGGGAPSKRHDIRLGDVVVGSPVGGTGGVLPYKFGKAVQEKKFAITGNLNSPPAVLLTALNQLDARHERKGHRIRDTIQTMVAQNPRLQGKYEYPGAEKDRWYESSFLHTDSNVRCDLGCGNQIPPVVQRQQRSSCPDDPIIHYGLIASADQLMKDAVARDTISEEHDVLCFEMEAAGLSNDFPCAVIRGICDYSDSHKNDEWQGYAAATAASYAKELLQTIPQGQVAETQRAFDVVTDSDAKFHAPFALTDLPVSGHFVNRAAEMQEMEKTLLPTKAPGTPKRRTIHVLHGLGGTGKTQLAIAYARKHQNTYSAIVWVNGNSRDTVLQSLAEFGRQAGISNATNPTSSAAQQAPDLEAEEHAVRLWLGSERNHRWLMIFDNVDRDMQSTEEEGGQAFDVTSFLPQADHGSILITSRLSSVGELGQSTAVGRLQLEQAQELLSHRSGLQPSSKDMKKLIERLGYLALALVQAGAYICKTKIGCSKYLELYEASWSRLAAETPRFRDYANGSIQTTWMISYECVRRDNATAGTLLQLWAYLDHQDVWYELFVRGRHGCRGCDWLEELAGSEIDFRRVMGSLLAYSLIEPHQKDDSYSMHPVVHDWCAETISHDREDLLLGALKIVGAAVPYHSEAAYWVLQRRLLPHAVRCVRQVGVLEALQQFKSVEASDALYKMGHLLVDQDKHTEAEEMYRRALDGKEKAWGPDHTSTLDTVNDLGLLYADQDKHTEAEEMYRRALDGKEKAWGPDHTSTLNTVNNLGLLYADQDKYTEAEEMYRRALVGYEKALGPDHTSTLNVVNNLGLLYADQDKHTEAEEMYRRALHGKEKAWGLDHTSTLDTVNNLANLYKYQGKHAEAEEMHRRALDGKEKAWGPNHTSTLDTVYNLANLYKYQGKHAEAEEMYRRALVGYEKVWSPDHTSILDTVYNLANLYRKQGKYSEAEEMYRRALDGYEKARGPDHTSTLNTVNNLASLYADQGKHAKAEEMYWRALDGYTNAQGSSHPITQRIARNLARLNERKQKPRKGEDS